MAILVLVCHGNVGLSQNKIPQVGLLRGNRDFSIQGVQRVGCNRGVKYFHR